MYALKCNEEYAAAALALIRSANETVLLSTFKIQQSTCPADANLQAVIQALQTAAQGGRKVKFLMNWEKSRRGVGPTDEKVAKHLPAAGADIAYLPDGRCCHSKILIADNHTMLLGSHNWSKASLTRNFEVSILVRDEIVIAATREVFYETWALARAWL